MISYLLDTSVIIDYLKGKSGSVELVENVNGSVNSSYFCLCELYDGVSRMITNQENAISKIEGFFETFENVFGVDKEVSWEFGKIRADLKKRGELIDDMDILIAATCLVYGQTLVTKNPKHFERIVGLKVKAVPL